jgi:hypothetical protein
MQALYLVHTGYLGNLLGKCTLHWLHHNWLHVYSYRCEHNSNRKIQEGMLENRNAKVVLLTLERKKKETIYQDQKKERKRN